MVPLCWCTSIIMVVPFAGDLIVPLCWCRYDGPGSGSQFSFLGGAPPPGGEAPSDVDLVMSV